MAHYGGWKIGKWGIIDYKGNWVVEPVFEDLGYDIYDDDLIIFYIEDKWSAPDEVPEGIYSIKQKKVIFEPQFMGIDFYDDGSIKVEKYDEKLERNVVNIIDLSGKPKFNQWYDSIWPRRDGKYYEVSIIDKDGEKLQGIIDKTGKNIIPCENNYGYPGIMLSSKRVRYLENGKFGVKNLSGNIIMLARYSEITVFHDKYYQIKIGGEANKNDEGLFGLMTLDGKLIIPVEYTNITMNKNILICKNDEGTTLYRFEEKLPKPSAIIMSRL